MVYNFYQLMSAFFPLCYKLVWSWHNVTGLITNFPRAGADSQPLQRWGECCLKRPLHATQGISMLYKGRIFREVLLSSTGMHSIFMSTSGLSAFLNLPLRGSVENLWQRKDKTVIWQSSSDPPKQPDSLANHYKNEIKFRDKRDNFFFKERPSPHPCKKHSSVDGVGFTTWASVKD